MTRSPRAPRVLLVAASVLVLVAACSTAPESRLLPPASSTTSTIEVTTTTRPDYSQVALAPMPGETTTTVPISEGSATVRGRVTGPDGGVAGAVVRIERLVGDAVQRTDVRAGGDGRFSLGGVPGGRYRVRSFLAPSLTMQEPEIFFVRDGEPHDVDFRLTAVGDFIVTPNTTPGTPIVGRGVNLAVQVVEQYVDGDGVVRQSPVTGVRVRVSSSGWTLLDPEPVSITSSAGIAVFQYRCDRVGAVSATAVVGEPAPPPRDPQVEEPPDAGAPDDGGDPSDDPEEATTTSTTTTTTTTTAVPAGGTGPFATPLTVPLDVPGCGAVPTTTTTAAPPPPDEVPPPTTAG